MQSVHGFRCYDNITPKAKCQRVLCTRSMRWLYLFSLSVCLFPHNAFRRLFVQRTRTSRVSCYLCCLQVNETLLRSIVTQPSSENYVYAYNFSALAQARNLVAGTTCRAYVPESTTTPSSTLPPINSCTYRYENCSLQLTYSTFYDLS